jgi:cephalosporin-C deacetylase-like acetyl esterase
MKTDLTRRAAAQTLAGLVLAGRGHAADFVPRPASYARELPDMLARYFERRLNALAAKGDVERAKVRGLTAIEARDQTVRAAVLEMLGGLPPKCPLQAVTAKVLQRDGYRIEMVMYQSRPDFWVTGNLYIPAAGQGPYPAILNPSGHYAEAARSVGYQLGILNLVKAGFVVLANDPIGQGERRLFWNPATKEELGTTIHEHSMYGQLLWLVGEHLMLMRVADAMCSIDYLLTRSEVDPKRIGCTGHSGGGHETLMTTALDPRIGCAVINEPGRRLGHWWPVDIAPTVPLFPGDAEHNLFPAAFRGIDYCDIYQAIAPRPLLVSNEDFSEPGLHLAARHLTERYREYGAADKFRMELAADAHYLTHKLRLATTDWFCRWLLGKPGPDREPDLEPEPQENLHVTTTGSLIHPRRGETLHDLIVKRYEAVALKRPAPVSATELEAFRKDVTGRLRKMLAFHAPEGPPRVRKVHNVPRKGYRVEKDEILVEEGVYVSVWTFVPDGRTAPGPAVVYLNEAGKQSTAISLEQGLLEKLARKGHLVIAADVRGTGETTPRNPNPFDSRNHGFLFSVEAAFSYMAWSMAESLLGMRVLDAIRTVDYALARKDVDPAGLKLFGSGMGAVWALCAAALDPRIPAVICERLLGSYEMLVRGGIYSHMASVMMLDSAKHLDLPDVAATLAGRRLTLVSPVDQLKRPLGAEALKSTYRVAAEAFRVAGSADKLRIEAARSGRDQADGYDELFRSG